MDDLPDGTIYRTAAPIVVDRRLDEPAWFAAPSAKLLYDDRNLYVAFLCQDAHIGADHTERDSAVCVEIFVAPNPQTPVTEEWNGVGTRISTFLAGTPDDDSDTDFHWIVEAALPLENFAAVAPHTPPCPDDVWRIALNRCGGKTNPQYSQWSSSATEPPSFHGPSRFGRMTFPDRACPF